MHIGMDGVYTDTILTESNFLRLNGQPARYSKLLHSEGKGAILE